MILVVMPYSYPVRYVNINHKYVNKVIACMEINNNNRIEEKISNAKKKCPVSSIHGRDHDTCMESTNQENSYFIQEQRPSVLTPEYNQSTKQWNYPRGIGSGHSIQGHK